MHFLLEKVDFQQAMLVYWRVTKLDDIWMTGFASVQWKCEEVNLSLFFPENGGMIVVLENYERHFFWWIWFEREGYLHYKSNCIYIYVWMYLYIYIYTGVSMYTQVYLYMWKCIHVPIPSFQSFFFTHPSKVLPTSPSTQVAPPDISSSTTSWEFKGTPLNATPSRK